MNDQIAYGIMLSNQDIARHLKWIKIALWFWIWVFGFAVVLIMAAGLYLYVTLT